MSATRRNEPINYQRADRCTAAVRWIPCCRGEGRGKTPRTREEVVSVVEFSRDTKARSIPRGQRRKGTDGRARTRHPATVDCSSSSCCCCSIDAVAKRPAHRCREASRRVSCSRADRDRQAYVGTTMGYGKGGRAGRLGAERRECMPSSGQSSLAQPAPSPFLLSRAPAFGSQPPSKRSEGQKKRRGGSKGLPGWATPCHGLASPRARMGTEWNARGQWH